MVGAVCGPVAFAACLASCWATVSIQAADILGDELLGDVSSACIAPCPRATIRLRGRVDTDAILTTQSAANTATFGDLGDVVGLRRRDSPCPVLAENFP